jgi:Cu/Ag efflux pump CusA
MGLKKSIYHRHRVAMAADLKESIMYVYETVKRIRPKIMTVRVILAGLILIMFSHGRART